jgi:MYXO-CTERM domain-containing protein
VSSLSVLGGSTSGALTFNVHKARFDPATAMLLGVPDARLGGQQYVYLEFANGDEFDVDHEGRTFGYMSLKAPEPTTWMLATVGLGALWRRRRRVPGRE